jgi:uncharacterized protein (DUF1778 family)
MSIGQAGNKPRFSGNRIVLTLSLHLVILNTSRSGMATQPIQTERRTEKLDVRVSPSAKAKLQAAASASHRSVSDFVMESALSRAEETLAERRIFGLDAEKWAAFQAALNAPPRPLPRLEALLDEPGFFESDQTR